MALDQDQDQLPPQPQPIYSPPTTNDYDLDDDDDDNDNDNISPSSSSNTDDNTPSTTTVTVAIPSSTTTTTTPPSATLALPHHPKKPPLFQRLWTDEDEIELLQGFLHYTSSRGPSHHHDTAAFYDQIKNKLQLDFNKNQLVEKLRRLKKKYRNVLSKINSGKDFAFKTPHDHATFEISRKIWSNLDTSYRGVVEFDDDDQNPSFNPNPNPNSIGGGGGGYYVGHINLNNAATAVAEQKTGYVGSYGCTPVKLSSRKRPRVEKLEDKFEGINPVNATTTNNNKSNSYNDGNISNVNNNNSNNVNVGSGIQGLIEETVRSCLSPMFKDLINNAVNGPGNGSGYGGGGGGGGGGGFKGVEALALNAIPLKYPGVNSGEVMDEKWRRQQILELEVYSKRLELVQDQIKLTLEELRSMSGMKEKGL